MPEEKIANIMRDFVKTMETGDVEKTLSFFTDDGVWVNPNGTFKGKDAVRRYFTVLSQSMRDMKVTESGNGIIVQGNKAFFEHVISGTFRGQRCEALAMCAYEFSGEKIKEIRSVFDRLLMAKQTAKGWLARSLVNFMAKQAEKGLR